jgi:hypothetical protein
MLGFDLDANAAARVEQAGHFDPVRVQGLDQVIQHLIDDVLVEGAFVAVGPQVELEGFRLDHLLVGDVGDLNGGEVRLAGERAQAGELGRVQRHQVIAAGALVGEGFQLLAGFGRLAQYG